MSFQVHSSTHIIWNYQELTGLIKGQSYIFFNLQIELSLSMICTLLQEKRRKKKEGEERSTMLSSSSSIISSHNHHFDYSGTVMCNPCVSMSPNHWAFSFWKVVLESFNMHKDLTVCCAQEGKTGTDEPAQVLTLKNWKMVLHPILNGSRTHSGPPAQHIKPLSYSPCWPFALSFNVIKNILNKWFPFKSSSFFFFSSGTPLFSHFCLISRHFKCTVPIVDSHEKAILACESVRELTGLAELHYIISPHRIAPFLLCSSIKDAASTFMDGTFCPDKRILADWA